MVRGYFFTNMYLSSLQKGLQSAHVIHELFTSNYSTDELLLEWAWNHKTMIILDGGFQSNLIQLEILFEKTDMYPWAAFKEEHDALNGAVTAVGIILPEKIYETASLVRQGHTTLDYLSEEGSLHNPQTGIMYDLMPDDIKIIQTLTDHRLAQ